MRLLFEKGHLLIPIIVLVVLIVMGSSLMRAAFVGCILTFIVSYFRKGTRMSFLEVVGTLESGARQAAPIGIVMAWVGIIMGLIASSGFGSKLGGTLLGLSGSSITLGLIITMFVALILGMGMTTLAVYIVVAVTLAPHLISLGVNLIAAHLFGFYFGCLSFVTPPVCLATYAAAALAGANVVKAGIRGFLVAISGFLIPYVIVFEPALILQGSSWVKSVVVFMVTAIGIVSLTSGISGFLIRKNSIIERVALICSGLLLILPHLTMSLLGSVIFAGVLVRQLRIRKKFLNP
jgi:TRAP transporter 4TM/12TM fusion protein